MKQSTSIQHFDEMLTITTQLFYQLESTLLYHTTPPPGPRVLDIGSGNGAYLSCYKQEFPNTTCVGLELDQGIYAFSKQKEALGINYINSSYECYEPTSKFDVVIARLVIRHISDHTHLLEWLKRHLNPKAVVHIIDADEDRLHFSPALPLFSELYRASRSRFPSTGWLEYKDLLRLEFEEAGFRLLRMERYNKISEHPSTKQHIYHYMQAVSRLILGDTLPKDLQSELQNWFEGPDETYGIHLFGMSWEAPK